MYSRVPESPMTCPGFGEAAASNAVVYREPVALGS